MISAAEKTKHSPDVQHRFKEGSIISGAEIRLPLLLPNLKAYCQNCDAITGTKILFMRTGLGNACAQCRQFRKGKRFISKAEFAELTKRPARESAEVNHGKEIRI